MQTLRTILVLTIGVTALAAAGPVFDPDPLLDQQWHLKDRATEIGGANVTAAWPQTEGAGVVIGIVDDGLQWTHPDLLPNYLASASFDFNDSDNDPTPAPGSVGRGTAAAGLAAARSNNSIGVAGVAPSAQIAGLRLTGAPTSDLQQGAAFSHVVDIIHILSSGWGALDDGATLDGPGPVATGARESAAITGRQGKGRVFVWAAGDGAGAGDNCNFDGYANSRFVIAVGATDDAGQQAPYSESCSALFVTAPSSGDLPSRAITTTDLVGTPGYDASDYTSAFGGTAASTAIVSGTAALMLARNSNLTWRDVQHVIRRTSARVSPSDPGWTLGAFPHHERFGFGLIDAKAASDLAAGWTNVPAEEVIAPATRNVNAAVPDNNTTGVSDAITIAGAESTFVVEHVEVELQATHASRGHLQVSLTSPSGAVSLLAPTRPQDSGANFSGWRFSSVRHWGESAAGAWTLKVADLNAGTAGTWNSWTIRVYGYHVANPPPGAFAKTAPVNGATDQLSSPTLNWTASSGATGYEYCLNDAQAGACGNWVSVGNTLSGSPTGLAPGVTYHWQVRATSASGLQTFANAGTFHAFTTTAVVPGAFAKTSPSSGVTNQATSVVLSWGTSSGATAYAYCLDTTNDNACDGSNWIAVAGTSVVPAGLAPNTGYYWQVRATSLAGTTYANGGAAVFWNFTTGAAPGPFVKTTPANGSSGQAAVTIGWTASASATAYEYCFDTSNNGACATWVNVGAVQSAALSGLAPLTTYYWQVRARTSNGSLVYANGGLSVFWSFTTSAQPGAFAKSAPVNFSAGQPASLTLAWTASAGVAQYEYCYDTTNDSACSGWVSAGTSLSANISGLDDDTTYFWQVRAVNASGAVFADGSVDEFWSFTTALPSLVQNGGFSSGLTGWSTFALPDSSYLITDIAAGVLRFYRNAPPPGSSGSGVILQQTGEPFVTGDPIDATFDIGNSSTARKRITVLIHDQDFSDLSVCSFWLAANAPMRTYRMVTHTTEDWIGATISFYAASTGSDDGYYLLDNVALRYAPSESVDRTTCEDPTAPAPNGNPAGPELLLNGDFATNSTASWTLFGVITQQVVAGVFEFIKPPGEPAGVILQPTGQAMAAGDIVTATFELGNSSGVRKRVTVLLHDASFGDLSACTFWLEPGQPLLPYAIRTFATTAWGSATLSVYPATVGAQQWMRLDNASMKKTPASATMGTDCLEPGAAPFDAVVADAVPATLTDAALPPAVERRRPLADLESTADRRRGYGRAATARPARPAGRSTRRVRA